MTRIYTRGDVETQPLAEVLAMVALIADTASMVSECAPSARRADLLARLADALAEHQHELTRRSVMAWSAWALGSQG